MAETGGNSSPPKFRYFLIKNGLYALSCEFQKSIYQIRTVSTYKNDLQFIRQWRISNTFWGTYWFVCQSQMSLKDKRAKKTLVICPIVYKLCRMHGNRPKKGLYIYQKKKKEMVECDFHNFLFIFRKCKHSHKNYIHFF